MPESINGYIGIETIRKNAGSPPTTFAFVNPSQSIMIDNLGTVGVFGDLTGSNRVTGSGAMYIPGNQNRVFDFKTGSVQLLASGAAQTSEVQVIGLR